MRTETSGPTSGPVFGFKFFSIRLLTGRPMIATCCGILNFSDMLFGIRLLGRFMFEVSPRISPLAWVHKGLPTAAPDISIGVATAQSFCGLLSGFESLPDPFQLHGCGASLLLCISAWPRVSEVWLVKLRCKNILMLRRCRSLVHGLAATALPSQFNFRLGIRVCHRLGVWVLVCQANK